MRFEVRRKGFESAMRRAGRKKSSLETYGRFLRAFGEWLGDRDPVDVASLIELEEWFGAWEDAYQARYGKAPSENTIRSHQCALSAFYDYLWRRDLVPSNPLAKMERAKGKTKRGKYLFEDEFNALLDEPVTPQEKIIVPLLAWTAMRGGEATSIAQGDVNLGHGSITIRQSKTEAGERIIPILPELHEALLDWFDYLRKLGLRDDRLPLLVTKNKTAMKDAYCWRVVKRVAGRAGVRPRLPTDKARENVSEVDRHTLRRTLSTLLLNGFHGKEPVRAEIVQALCGHDDVRTTLAYYAQVEQSTMAEEIRRAVG